MTQITIDASNDLPHLQNNIDKLTARLGDLSPLMDAIGQILEDNTKQRFDDKTAPTGASWANLLESTQAKKGNNNILVQYGDLFRSITHQADKYSVTVGTPETYGVYHQFGTDKMTARPFLGLSADDEQDIYELINDYLTDD